MLPSYDKDDGAVSMFQISGPAVGGGVRVDCRGDGYFKARVQTCDLVALLSRARGPLSCARVHARGARRARAPLSSLSRAARESQYAY